MKVLVIPEDPTYNGYLLKPLVEKLLASAGRPRARVRVLSRPSAQGYEAVKGQLRDIAERYRHFDLLLFLPDDDGVGRNDRPGDQNELRRLEAQAAEVGATLIACAAAPEVEAWLLAGHLGRLPAAWSAARAERDFKERYFQPFLAQFGDASAGGGRERLMREALSHFSGMLARCPELQQLQDRLRDLLGRM